MTNQFWVFLLYENFLSVLALRYCTCDTAQGKGVVIIVKEKKEKEIFLNALTKQLFWRERLGSRILGGIMAGSRGSGV